MSRVADPALTLRARLKRDTWFAIRDAAYQLMAERGFEAVGVEDIAAAAGISRATFFNYFPNKLSVVQDPGPGEREAWQVVFDRPSDEPLWDSLVAALVGHAVLAADQAVKVRRLYKHAPELHALGAGHTHPFYVDLRAFVAQRTPRAQRFDADLLVNMALSVVDSTFLQWSPSVRSPFADLLQATLDRIDIRLAPTCATL